MTNPYYVLTPLTQHTVARAEAVNAQFQAVSDAFGLLPDPTKVADGSFLYATDSGAKNAYLLTPQGSVTAYRIGQIFFFQPLVSNDAASTVNIYNPNTVLIGSKNIVRGNGSATQANDIPAGGVVLLAYDGTSFRLAGFNGSIDAAVQASAAAAAASASAALISQNAASTSATNAAASATTAAAQATAAAASATTATTQAGNAATSATAAAASAAAAAATFASATSANTASTVVKRDGSGNFSAGTISAALTGHASADLALAGGTMTGTLAMGANAITGTGANSAGSIALGGATIGTNALAISGTAAFTSSNATAFVVGQNGATNPAFRVDASAADSVTGILVSSASAGEGVQIAIISSGTDESLSINAKGSGNVSIGFGSTGAIVMANDTHIDGALTLNGGTLLFTSDDLDNGSGSSGGTLLNAPSAGNPTKWVAINDNGTVRHFPCW